MDASVRSAMADAPMRSKRVTKDSTFRGALFTALLVKTESLPKVILSPPK